MSVSKEERAEWRNETDAWIANAESWNRLWPEKPMSAYVMEISRRVSRLLDALEQAEAERDVLAGRVVDYGTGPCPDGTMGYCANVQADIYLRQPTMSRCFPCLLKWAKQEAVKGMKGK